MEIEKDLDYIVIPKNSGLEKCKRIAYDLLKEYSKIQEVREEDVPLFTEKLIEKNKKVVGITGEDLFKEFLLNNRNSQLKILKRFSWEDNSFIYKKPALCLLGNKSKKFKELPKSLKICINSKYKELAKKYCINLLENKGYSIDKIYASGAIEEFLVKGLVDAVIDIVCTGKSAEKAGLAVYNRIFDSDIVIIGRIQENKNLDLERLYQKIFERIKGNSEYSYTVKLSNNLPLLYRKIIEEAGEVITAKSKDELIWEISDLIYFIFVIMAKNSISIKDIENENERRNKKESIKNSEGDAITWT